MDTTVFNKVEASQLKKRPAIKVGDTVKLHLKIKEGEKERVQIFEGFIIAMSGIGLNRTITVRKISNGVGVERIVPLHAPTLDKIEIIKRGDVRKAKLYHMRELIGKRAMDTGGSYYTEPAEEVVAPVEEVTPVVEEKPVEETKTE